jgi:Na+/H+ antiporter NhaD/arsenite permease-like protein
MRLACTALLLSLLPCAAWAASPAHGFDSTRDPVSQGLVALAIICMFAALSLDRAHRVLVVMAALALIFVVSYFTPWRLLSFETAKDAIDLNIILLLLAMMALVGVLKTTNVFPWAVDQLLVRSRGDPGRATKLIIWFTGILSAFLDNVTTVIFTYPMSADMARRLGINASAILLPMIMAANIGGTATLIGDPPNVLIGVGAGLPFMEFIYNLAMPCTLMMFVLVWYARRYYPADIGSGFAQRSDAAIASSGARIRNVPLLKATLAISALIFIGFGTHTFTGMPVAVPALIGIALVLIAQDWLYLKANRPSHEERQHGILQVLEKDVEWPTLVFFLFLFAIVGAAVATGLIDSIATGLAAGIDSVGTAFALSTTGRLLLAALVILWFSGFLSAVIDNIPYTAVSIPIIASLQKALGTGDEGQILWWALALGACLGGNGTLIGASANVTVVGLAEKDGKRISFREFTAFGARVTAITLVISTVYLVLWLYVGSRLVNFVGTALILLAIAFSIVARTRRTAGA